MIYPTSISRHAARLFYSAWGHRDDYRELMSSASGWYGEALDDLGYVLFNESDGWDGNHHL